MKTFANTVVLTILSCGLVRSYRVYSNDNSAKLETYPETYPDDSSQDDTYYKWDPRKNYGDFKGSNFQSYDQGKETKRQSKEIQFPDEHYNSYEPEYGFPEYHEERFPEKSEYPTYKRSKEHKVRYWPYPRQWRQWSDGGWAFPDADADPFAGTRFPEPSTSSTTAADQIWTQRVQKNCIFKCPTTPEYNPVCGTDAKNYTNLGSLECAKYCGVDVELYRQFPCSPNMLPVQKPITMPTTPAPVVTKPTTQSFEAPGSTTVCPEDSDECYEIDVRSRNLKLDDKYVFTSK